jgi:RND family efflux transporter MFP subunit
MLLCPAISSSSAATLDCLVVPYRIAEVAFGSGGVVAEILVDRGDKVKKGELLGRLDSSVEDANLAIARARLADASALQSTRAQLRNAESKRRRNEALRDKDIVAASKFEDAALETELAQTRVLEQEEAQRLKQLEIGRAEAVLALRSIASPLDGVVVERHVSPGELVENRRAVTIAQIDPVFADVIAPSALFAGLRKGQNIKVVLSQPDSFVVEGGIAVVDPYVDGASGTFRARIALANPDGRIVPGFRCRALVDGEGP